MQGNRFSKSTMLRWKGAYAAAISVFAGAQFFMLIDSLLIVSEISSGGWVWTLIFLAGLSGLFALPFSLVAGYLLGWFLEKKQWHLPGDYRPAVAGAIIAAISITIIFIIGGIFQTCLTSHGMCEPDPIGYIWTAIKSDLSPGPLSEIGQAFILRFLEALIIAIMAGAITGHYLSRQGRYLAPKPTNVSSITSRR